jgi:hypothetical protein
MTSGERWLTSLLAAVAAVLLAAWLTEPPRRGPAGAVPTPTAVVSRDEGIERDLCGYVRGAPPEGVDLAYVGAAGRDPRVRYALALAASSYAQDGSAGGREQFLLSCSRAGHG